ncbi:MAG: hypothetical protein IJ679_08515, partial [Lachnospiraceae bacterium]|nr:hypothetical protein [Lachnospiraceae bacterium]
QTVYLGSAVKEPTTIPQDSSGEKMFFQWRTAQYNPGTASGNSDVYDFSKPLSGALALYAYWTGKLDVPIQVVDASTKNLKELDRSASDWTIGSLKVGTTAVSLTDGIMVEAANNYRFAFAASSSDISSISEEKAVEAIRYDPSQKKLCVQFKGQEAFTPLEQNKLYYIYYKQKTLDIAYKWMNTTGELADVSVSEKTKKTGDLGETNLADLVKYPLNGVDSKYTSYAFAIGASEAATASSLQLITKPSVDDASSPALYVRNSWQGIEYSADQSNWMNAGYDPALYVLYFEKLPSIITIREETVGTRALVNSQSFHYSIEIKDENGDGTTAFDLKSGESWTIAAYYWEEGGKKYAQTVTIKQESDSGFATTYQVDDSNEKEGTSWSYTAKSTGESPKITFTNTDKSESVEIHVAQLEENGFVAKDSLRQENAATFELALGMTETLLSKAPSADVFSGDKTTLAFGAIGYGNQVDEDTVIETAGLDAVSISYEKAGKSADNIYALVLKNKAGETVCKLGKQTIYYLYYPMPQIRYVKEESYGLFSNVTGAAGSGITYDKKSITMNDKTVAQDQYVDIAQDGFRFSQTGGKKAFRMPPILDDESYPRYLAYSSIGIGRTSATKSDDLYGENTELFMQMRIAKGGLQYSFDSENWEGLSVSGTPTIFAIYTERGYDLQLSKIVNTKESGSDPIFTEQSFTVTVESTDIKKTSYKVDGMGSAKKIEATPADG